LLIALLAWRRLTGTYKEVAGSVSCSPCPSSSSSPAGSVGIQACLCNAVSACVISVSTPSPSLSLPYLSLPASLPPSFPHFLSRLLSICPSLSPSNDLSSLRLDLLSASPIWRRNEDVCRVMRSACVFLVCRGTQALTAARVWRRRVALNIRHHSSLQQQRAGTRMCKRFRMLAAMHVWDG